jgi:hypothetical protein
MRNKVSHPEQIEQFTRQNIVSRIVTNIPLTLIYSLRARIA